jgi:predicted amidohydrolase
MNGSVDGLAELQSREQPANPRGVNASIGNISVAAVSASVAARSAADGVSPNAVSLDLNT